MCTSSVAPSCVLMSLLLVPAQLFKYICMYVVVVVGVD